MQSALHPKIDERDAQATACEEAAEASRTVFFRAALASSPAFSSFPRVSHPASRVS